MAEKRKRKSDTIPRPAKRAAVSSSELGPIIASTPGLSLANKTTFAPYSKPSKSSQPAELLLQSSTHPILDYTAREDHDVGSTAHYIAIYDPSTKKLDVHPAKKMTVRGSLRRERVEVQQDAEAAKGLAQQQIFTLSKRQELGLEFGGAKARKAIQSITENAIRNGQTTDGDVTADPLTAALLKGITDSTADMPTADDLKSAIDESRPRPKADLNASIPADVYPLDTLIPRNATNTLPVQDWISAVEAGEAIKVQSRYVSRRILALVQSGEIKQLRALRWLLCLLSFYKSLKSGGRGAERRMPKREVLEKAMGIPNILISEIVRKYAPQGSDLSKWHVDYLITHICALTLHVDNYDVDTFDLHEDLSLDARAMANYYQEIGCKVAPPTEAERIRIGLGKAEALSHRIAKLRVPVTFKTAEARRLKTKRR